MPRKIRARKAYGQALVEYALVLVLVALVAIVILWVVGRAANKSYGLVCGVFGCKKEYEGVLTFNGGYPPRCGYVESQGTGLYFEIIVDNTVIGPGDFTVSTDQGDILGVEAIAGGYKVFQPLAFGVRDDSLCPHSIIIQTSKSTGGLTVVSPVLIQDWS